MLVISRGLILQPQPLEHPDAPVIGSDNIVKFDNIAASSEADGYPARNLANAATDQEWRASAIGAQTLTLSAESASDVDYVGVAGHNWGSAEIVTSVEVDDGEGYTSIIERVLPDDRPAIFRFPKVPRQTLRISLAEGTEPARASVIYVGAAIVLPRLIYVGHSPITYARERSTVQARSVGGHYLGGIILGEGRKSTIEQKNIDPDWYRETLDPVIAGFRPFFFAWRPNTYPHETGYVWVTGSPKPSNQRSNGMMSISIPIEGLA